MMYFVYSFIVLCSVLMLQWWRHDEFQKLPQQQSKTTTTTTTCVEKCTPYPEPRKVQSRNVFGSSEISFVWFSLKGLIFFFSPYFRIIYTLSCSFILTSKKKNSHDKTGLDKSRIVGNMLQWIIRLFPTRITTRFSQRRPFPILDECFLDIDNNLYFTNHSHPNQLQFEITV